MPTNDDNGSAQEITLRDVIAHIQGVKDSLELRMDQMESRLSVKIDENTRGIAQNTVAIQNLSVRVQALEEDIGSTMNDAIKIRRHVGMAVAED